MLKKRYLLGMLFVSIILSGCLPDEEHQTKPNSEVVPTSGIEEIATKLRIPWSIDFDGQVFCISRANMVTSNSRK
ncbi:hypothetical protein [Pallidibacillus thermolactis]|jgi:hypothetical protein|uniref:hypothetical protein n=1 Tax=Pallidibacillus thermolactis TaxID=251051 RepID=UPI002E23CBDD|nr:hypothetical protein [Pallidibacillus thermolactis subsp. kokeshiiformis]